MLPPPALSFTIPSINDDLVLQCRVYHPACFAPTKLSQISEWRKRAAIVAHPYAPLGGCYDDPVVDIVASTILNQGFIVGTFNFRGAASSKGRTSWQSKPEQSDYMSFIGFMIYYLHRLSPPVLPLEQPKFSLSDPELHDLSPVPSQAVPPPRNSEPRYMSPTSSNPTPFEKDDLQIPYTTPCLLLAGYSYGAMITTSLPPAISSIIHPFQTPAAGSAQAEIRLRADCLADQQNELLNSRLSSLLAQVQRRPHTEDRLLSNPKTRKTSGGVRVGGEEDLRRPSYESHRSRNSFTLDAPEIVRKSVDRVRSIAKSSRFPPVRANSRASVTSSSKKKGCESESSTEMIGPDEDVGKEESNDAIKEIPGIASDLQMAYLLVSPLQGWINDLATLWASKSGKQKTFESDLKLAIDPTLAIFGDDDVFVSVKRLRAWAERLAVFKIDGKTSHFKYREVSGAGHFWHDYEAIQALREEVKAFVASL